jgi:O-antigen/teichoic acid export membrane protein
VTLSKIQTSNSSQIGIDILLNFVGKGWVAFSTVLFAPYFIQSLGVEAYGLLGFFATLQATFLLVDFGCSTALNRAIASGNDDVSSDVYALAHKLERMFFTFSLIIFIANYLGAPWLAVNWLKSTGLDASQVKNSIQLMGGVIALQLPFMLYAGGLTGLRRHVKLNAILVFCTTLRFGGGLIVLALINKFEAFLIWQIITTGIQTCWARSCLFQDLKKLRAHNIQPTNTLKEYARFSFGVGMTAILGAALTQLDKVILSRLLTLEEYGYYIMAWTLSTTLFLFASPVVTAFFPRLTAEITKIHGAPDKLYHTGYRILASVVSPAAALLLFFPGRVLTLWVGDHYASDHTANLIVLLAIGTLLNTAAQLPHALQLAHGRFHFGLYANIALAVLTVPLLYIAVGSAGAHGAAYVWIISNAVYVLIGIPLMHRWLLRDQYLYWLSLDVLVPVLTAFTMVLIIAGSFSWTENRSLGNLVNLAVSYLLSFAACLLVSWLVRGIPAPTRI